MDARTSGNSSARKNVVAEVQKAHFERKEKDLKQQIL